MQQRAALAAAVLASAGLYGADYREVNRTVALGPGGSVTLTNHKGSIHVTTWDRPEIEIKARIEMTGWSEQDRRLFEQTEVRIDASADSARIETRYPEPNNCCGWTAGSNPDVHYNIQMPRTASLSIRDHRSDTDVSDLAGALDIETHRGIVHVHDLSGALSAKTHRGETHAGFRALNEASRIETYRGEVEVLLPWDSRFNLHSRIDRGSLDSDFPVMARLAGHRRGESIDGAVNGGGVGLTLATSRGTIRLRVK